ncbi:MAG: hypothetical protein J3R72DRAFT_470026 [Linnemannia gamsii]|nr:MAG: hypothetical protein J3R72DRAFT_470026 [Linnemannia gamsii]
MESPGHLNGNSTIPAADPASDASQSSTPQNPADTVGILKQQLIKIARNKHEKLTKDVKEVLQRYSTVMESDLIYIINEYTSTKSELDDAAREISQLTAVNATLTEQLRVATETAQHVRPGTDNPVQDKTLADNLQLELNITTKELYRALEDVEKLKEQKLQMEVAIGHKDVVNQQLAAVITNRQAENILKQKENAELCSSTFKHPNGGCQPYSNHPTVNTFADSHQRSFDRSIAHASQESNDPELHPETGSGPENSGFEATDSERLAGNTGTSGIAKVSI